MKVSWFDQETIHELMLETALAIRAGEDPGGARSVLDQVAAALGMAGPTEILNRGTA